MCPITFSSTHTTDDNAFIHDAGTNGTVSPMIGEYWQLTTLTIVPQVLPHEAKARQSAEAESSYPTVDPPTNRQHHPVYSTVPSYKLKRQFQGYRKDRTNRTCTDITPSDDIGARPESASRLLALTHEHTKTSISSHTMVWQYGRWDMDG
jgi:hypothetical protein